MAASSNSFLAFQNFWSEASSVTVVRFAIIMSSAGDASMTEARARVAWTDCAATLPGLILRFRRTRILMRLPHSLCSAIARLCINLCGQDGFDLESDADLRVEDVEVLALSSLQECLHGIVH